MVEWKEKIVTYPNMTRQHQLGFADIFFDTMFGLVIFYAIDGLMELNSAISFMFYIFSMIIVIHWWLIFKSSDDAFGTEVKDSATDLMIGLIDIILVDYVVLFAKSFDYVHTNYFLITLIAMDLVWALMWKHIGEWRTKSKKVIKEMEKELTNTIIADVALLTALILLALTASMVSSTIFALGFMMFYSIYIYLTWKLDIIDMKIF